MWKYLIFVLVWYTLPSQCTISYINGTVVGHLNDSWRIHFTLLADDFQGLIIHCFDWDKNQFKIKITRANNNEKSVRISYNKIQKTNPLKLFKSCDHCGETSMSFDLSLYNLIFDLKINNVSLAGFTAANGGAATVDESSPLRSYVASDQNPFPANLVTKKELITIYVGNIAPYISEKNVSVFPSREQIVGCLDRFLYNDRNISWTENGGQIRSSCPWRCADNVCNGGRCRENGRSSVICDCWSAPLNGVFCNQSLTAYTAGANHSFQKRQEANKVRLKLTWRQLLIKEYCLVEAVAGRQAVLLWLKGRNLMLGDREVATVNEHGVNAVTVKAANNRLAVNFTDSSGHRQGETEFVVETATRVNIGFSERDGRCETFEGVFDVVFEPLQVVQTGQRGSWIKYVSKVTGRTSRGSLTITPDRGSTPASTWTLPGNNQVLLVGTCIGIILILLCAANLYITLRCKEKVKKRNIYEDVPEDAAEVFDVTDNNNETAANTDGRTYNTVDYTYIRGDDDEDIDGYILPKKIQLSAIICHPLPPRND